MIDLKYEQVNRIINNKMDELANERKDATYIQSKTYKYFEGHLYDVLNQVEELWINGNI